MKAMKKVESIVFHVELDAQEVKKLAELLGKQPYGGPYQRLFEEFQTLVEGLG